MGFSFNFGGAGGGNARSASQATGGASQTVPVTGGKAATSKLGSIVNTVGGLAAKYGNLIPGVGGIVSTVGKLVSSNDPEWWMNVPGTGVSTNIPLSARTDKSLVTDIATNSPSAAYGEREVFAARPAILEFTSSIVPAVQAVAAPIPTVVWPTESMISTYLVQNVRKVVNAIPLQNVNAYRDVIACQATAYALKHNLDKYIVLAKNSKPFIPAMTDGSYPILAPENYAILVGMRDRLAEYCKASVRLPHTMCQYLAWRYGRVYRTGTSDKCGLVMYNILSMNRPLADYQTLVTSLLGFVASKASIFTNRIVEGGLTYLDVYDGSEKMQAQADLYNAYLHHIADVQISDDTQFIYDPKEFVLRTNLDVLVKDPWYNVYVNAGYSAADHVYMDSLLDNKTTFMASTVSTATAIPGNSFQPPLFPVTAVAFYGTGENFVNHFDFYWNTASLYVEETDTYVYPYNGEMVKLLYRTIGSDASWWKFDMTPIVGVITNGSYYDDNFRNVFLAAALCKSMEYYNAEIYVDVGDSEMNRSLLLDLTRLSQDLALVSADIIQNTQVYAFANLVIESVTSYAAKEAKALHADATATVKTIVDNVTPSNVSVKPVTATGATADVGSTHTAPTPS